MRSYSETFLRFFLFFVLFAPLASASTSKLTQCNPILIGLTAFVIFLILLVILAHIGPIRNLYCAAYHRSRGSYLSVLALESFYLAKISREEAQKRMKPHGYGLCKVDDQYGMTTLAEMAKPTPFKQELTREEQERVTRQNEKLANMVVKFYQLRDGYLAEHNAEDSFIIALSQYGFHLDNGQVKTQEVTATENQTTVPQEEASVTLGSGSLYNSVSRTFKQSIVAKLFTKKAEKTDDAVKSDATQNTTLLCRGSHQRIENHLQSGPNFFLTCQNLLHRDAKRH
ncbi:hypothetical protein L596_027570 [Steinernema carpocapsae]|uniref:Uncharacterized protein n=1 Tax=Steinernema carpocapsae TaxID=34508 RepID=A0A4V5ZXM1_STECR|nr:hypothetical protein L596_027570 [Steinernema carpocapsae]